MSEENKLLNSSRIMELSESEDGLYMTLVGQLCYLEDYNANGIRLLKGDKFEENLNSLVETPVVAKYVWSEENGSDFSGHEAYRDWLTGEILFGTEAIGVHQKVWVEDKMVKPVFSENEKLLPVIMYKAKIWKDRFPNFATVIKKLYNKGNLGTSWELIPNELSYEECEIKAVPNPRSSSDWTMLGDCLLGADILGAYEGTSKVVNISSSSTSHQITDALKEDLKNQKSTSSDDDNKEKTKNKSNERSEEMEQTIKNLQEQLDVAESKLKEYEEAGKDAEIAELKVNLESIKAEKSEVEDKLIKASATLETITSEVEELRPYKVEVEKIEAEKAEFERTEKIAELKTMVTKGGWVTEEELETSEEIKNMIENCEEDKLTVLRAERILEKLDKDNGAETSEAKETATKKRNFSEENKEIGFDFAKDFLGL